MPSSSAASVPTPNKILVIRASAMGDIVLTTPVLRSLRQALPQAQIHFLVKPQFADAIRHSPHIDKLHILHHRLGYTIRELRAEKFDHVIDLHKNLRSLRIRAALGRPASSFSKQNWRKWRMVNLKEKLSCDHIVQRYAQALAPLGIALDAGGLDYTLPDSAVQQAYGAMQDWYSSLSPHSQLPVAIVLGATHYTKRWPTPYFADLIQLMGLPVVLLGGPAEVAEAEVLAGQLTVPYLNAVGRYDIPTSAALMRQCQFVVTHDTGFMHIAAAFQMKILSIWGNTLPEFGMYPYQVPYIAAQVAGLSCRPCTKIGYKHCPKGHFNCMQLLTPQHVLDLLRQHQYLR